jgi:hypothetical protein
LIVNIFAYKNGFGQPIRVFFALGRATFKGKSHKCEEISVYLEAEILYSLPFRYLPGAFSDPDGPVFPLVPLS